MSQLLNYSIQHAISGGHVVGSAVGIAAWVLLFPPNSEQYNGMCIVNECVNMCAWYSDMDSQGNPASFLVFSGNASVTL